jgi:serralysin
LADIPGNSSTSASIDVGGTINNSLETVGDHDWFAITLAAGESITITLNGVTLEDPYLRIVKASGLVLAENDDINPGIVRDSKLSFTATTAGTYYIDAGAFDNNYAGTYELSVKPYEPPPVATYDQIADQEINGYWGPGEDHHFNVSQGGTITVNLTALTSAGQYLARQALALWTDVFGVTFTEVTTGGKIKFDDNEEGAATSGTWSNGIATSAHVNVSTQWLADYGTGLDSYSFQSYVHEIGHALGLGHTGYYNGTADYKSDALFANDSWSTSIMSYFDQHQNTYFKDKGFDVAFAVTPMGADIVAMSQMYGLSTTTRTGNTTYGFNSTANRDVYNASLYPDVAYTIIDSGGTDTLDYSGFGGAQRIDLNPVNFSNVLGNVGNVSIATGTVIENANGGAGNDTILGNGASNVLTGNGGNDMLDGGAGADTLVGGGGNDIYVVDNAGDSITENSGAGADVVQSSASFTLQANVEDLTMTGAAAINAHGNDLANVVTGNGAANSLWGMGGNDTLHGGGGNDVIDGGVGNDTMDGGAGNDTYVVDASGDSIGEGASAGTDLVEASVTETLGANLENLTLTGALAINGNGNGLANAIDGNDAANKLFGLAGADKLMGHGGNDTLDGGTGADKLYGGAGNDKYIVDNAGDVTTENSGEGTDLVTASVGYTLRANVENLTLTGSAAIDGTGNALDNVITGNAAANDLSGLIGGDTLYGKGGDDTLSGGDGADWLSGGVGTDHLFGGAGNDKFAFDDSEFGGATQGTADEIHDFAGGDLISLRLADANSALAGDQNFSFLGAGLFSGHAGELRYDQIDGNTFVQGDTNGDGVADFMIRVDGLHALTSGDFIL